MAKDTTEKTGASYITTAPGIKTFYKLVLLYTLDQLSVPMTNAQISDFFLENGYTFNYLSLQEILADLTETGLIRPEPMENTTWYSITPDGQETLACLKNDLPLPIRQSIRDYLAENRMRLRDAASIQADYYRTTGGEYAVRCRVQEKKEAIIDLTILVPDEGQAKTACGQWHKKCQELYSYLMGELLSEEKKP